MNVNISGHHLEITPSIRDYVGGKLARVSRHFDHVIDVRVILSIERNAHKAEVTVHVSGKDLFVETQHEDMYAAIDNLIDKLDRQILKHKGKLSDRPHDALKHMPEHADQE